MLNLYHDKEYSFLFYPYTQYFCKFCETKKHITQVGFEPNSRAVSYM